MALSAAIDDVRLSAGLYDIREAARLIDLPEQAFRRWARGYEHGAPLLHMLNRDARRESSGPASQDPPGTGRAEAPVRAEYVLMAPNLRRRCLAVRRGS
jgi:Putative DNA-binding HTH domain